MSSRKIVTRIRASITNQTSLVPVKISNIQNIDVIQNTPVTALKPNPRNARTHAKKQVRQIANSITQFGWTSPIVVDEHQVIIAGHGRYLAAQHLGLESVPTIVVTGLSRTKKRALTLADNKIAANAGWDRAALALELGELARLLPEYDLDLDITGFEVAEIDLLMADMADPEIDPADQVIDSEAKPVSIRDDLWLLDRHRLLCGDATLDTDWDRLMDGVVADMMAADIPYNVRISSVGGRGRVQHREFASASGEMSPDQFTAFLTQSMAHAASRSRDGSLHFIFMDWRHMREILAAGYEVYSDLINLIVWAKTNAGQGSFYRSQHELIFVFRNGTTQHRNNIELGRHGRNRSNVWSYPGVNTFRTGRMDDLAVHPTVKPVAMIADAIRDCTRRGDIVLDPFMGSGTTILAAERVGRRGFGMDIDPLYVDVAIRRWQAFTGKDAILDGSGQTFDEIAALRAIAPKGRRK